MARPVIRTSFILTILAMGVTFLFSSEARAQTEDDARDVPARILVSPLVYVASPGEAATGEEPSAGELASALRTGVERYLARHPEDFDYVPFSKVAQEIRAAPTHADMVAVAAEWGHLGIEKYKELDPAGAVANLERSYARFAETNHEYIAPEQVAEILMYLALGHLEQGGDPGKPLEVMTRMILLEPDRILRPGFYPDQVVQFYRSARLTLERQIRESGPSTASVRELAALAEVDYVAVANAVAAGGQGYDVFVHLWSVADEVYLPVETVRVDALTPQALEAAGNGLISRYIACLREPEEVASDPVAPSRGESPWSMQLNFTYASFLGFPGPSDLVPFGHMGATVGVGFYLTREFALMGLFQFLTSTTEYNGYVQDHFATVRGFLGGDLGTSFWRLRLSIAALFEVASLGEFDICSEPSRLGACRDPRAIAPGTLAGINLRPRLSYRMFDSTELFAGGSTSFYFFPLSDNYINFPTAAEFGIQYRF